MVGSAGGPWRSTVGALVAVALPVMLLLALPHPAAGSGAGPALLHSHSIPVGRSSTIAAPMAGPVSLGITAAPASICAHGSTNCPAGTGVSRVTMRANVTGGGNWSAAQLVFVLDTSLYTGSYDPSTGDSGSDPCAAKLGAMACEESNGLPVIVHNATQIAASIQSAHPGTTVSFAMVDYFATMQFDDGDGAEYHVDIANFTTNTTQFGNEAISAFGNISSGTFSSTWTYPDMDFSDNILHSSSITALYGALEGFGLAWSNSTHHVVVWVGATAPRDPGYTQNYCVAPTEPGSVNNTSWSGCYSASCEPSYAFASGVSPNCEGWVASQSGNASHSIAALARNGTSCVNSLGGQCTIDTVDLWATPTDPSSKGWPAGLKGGGPGGPLVKNNTDRVLLAGCDLANATNGSWDGPKFFTCPSGASGTLGGTFRTNLTINWSNPTLIRSLSNVSMGAAAPLRPVPGRPVFTFVPYGNVTLAPDLAPQTTCLTSKGPFTSCAAVPTVVRDGRTTYLGWNWSSSPSSNLLAVGDAWTASFNVISNGGAFGTQPLDVCSAPGCAASEGNVSASLASGVAFLSSTGDSQFVSFPLFSIVVSPLPLLDVGVSATPVSPLVGDTTHFLAHASGGAPPYTFRWSFGDGSNGSGLAPAHVFLRPWTYAVVATVTDSVGEAASTTFELPVGTVPITSTLIVDQSATTVGRPIQFASSESGGYSTYSFEWLGLPEGCASANTSALTCVPTVAGAYKVVLVTSDSSGDQQTATADVLVNPPIAAYILASPARGCTGGSGTPVMFTANVTGGTPAYTLAWSFGDGAMGSGSYPLSHTYARPGSYPVTLSVFDSVGASVNATSTVKVGPATGCGGTASSSPTMFGGGSPGTVILGLAIVAIGGVSVFLIARRSR